MTQSSGKLLWRSRVSAGRRPVVLERPKCLAHVAEFAKGRIRLFGLRAAGRLLGRTPASCLKEENDKQSSDGKEDDDSGYHTWMGRRRRETVARR